MRPTQFSQNTLATVAKSVAFGDKEATCLRTRRMERTVKDAIIFKRIRLCEFRATVSLLQDVGFCSAIMQLVRLDCEIVSKS